MDKINRQVNSNLLIQMFPLDQLTKSIGRTTVFIADDSAFTKSIVGKPSLIVTQKHFIKFSKMTTV